MTNFGLGMLMIGIQISSLLLKQFTEERTVDSFASQEGILKFEILRDWIQDIPSNLTTETILGQVTQAWLVQVSRALFLDECE